MPCDVMQQEVQRAGLPIYVPKQEKLYRAAAALAKKQARRRYNTTGKVVQVKARTNDIRVTVEFMYEPAQLLTVSYEEAHDYALLKEPLTLDEIKAGVDPDAPTDLMDKPVAYDGPMMKRVWERVETEDGYYFRPRYEKVEPKPKEAKPKKKKERTQRITVEVPIEEETF